MPPTPPIPSSRPVNESAVLVALAAVMFTHVTDFMIMMPLGPQFMRAFAITPERFSLLVASYSFSAGLTGFLAGLVMDRFDRKHALLFLYSGFGCGTLCCALAPNYALLLVARTLAGGFGGVAGSVVYAAVADIIPLERRGRAMGVIMTSFSMASIAGVPLGLTLANAWGWHAPFFFLGGASAVIWLFARSVLPRLPAHPHSGAHPVLDRMRDLLAHANHQRAFALIAVLTAAGGLIYPFLSPSLVTNAEMPERQLSLIYLFGGAATFLTSNYFGRLSDRHGRLRVFTWLGLLSIAPTLAVATMKPLPTWGILIITTIFMILTAGRFVPSMAMVTASVEARYRGGFMSVNSAVQQLSAGIATAIAGQFVSTDVAGRMAGYPRLGALSSVLVVLAVLLARRVRVAEEKKPTGAGLENVVDVAH